MRTFRFSGRRLCFSIYSCFLSSELQHGAIGGSDFITLNRLPLSPWVLAACLFARLRLIPTSTPKSIRNSRA